MIVLVSEWGLGREWDGTEEKEVKRYSVITMAYLADSDGPIFSVKVHAEPFLGFK